MTIDLSNDWSLGNDDYCETCGSSFNQVVFEDWEEGEYQLICV